MVVPQVREVQPRRDNARQMACFHSFSAPACRYLFAWNTTRHRGGGAQFSDRTKRILEVFHHKPTAFGINRTNWTQPALLKAYESMIAAALRSSRSTTRRYYKMNSKCL